MQHGGRNMEHLIIKHSELNQNQKKTSTVFITKFFIAIAFPRTCSSQVVQRDINIYLL